MSVADSRYRIPGKKVSPPIEWGDIFKNLIKEYEIAVYESTQINKNYNIYPPVP